MKNSVILKLFMFCLVLLFIRIFKTGHFSFLFLLWNLFLAWLPYWFIQKYHSTRTRPVQYAILGLTILFLPNAPYIVTDLFHLTKNLLAPMWFDLILILTFSLLGLIFFILTTERIFTILMSLIQSHFWFRFAKFLIILLTGYGIYLGRYLRFNSWDIVYNPDNLALRVFHSFFDAGSYKETFSVTITFTIFLYLVFEIYESLKSKQEKPKNEVFK
jgi:uncharacterized membrane protein